MTAPFLRDPRDRDDRLQIIAKVAVFGGALIGAIIVVIYLGVQLLS